MKSPATLAVDTGSVAAVAGGVALVAVADGGFDEHRLAGDTVVFQNAIVGTGAVDIAAVAAGGFVAADFPGVADIVGVPAGFGVAVAPEVAEVQKLVDPVLAAALFVPV